MKFKKRKGREGAEMEDNRKYREEIEKLKSSYRKSPKRKYSIRKALRKVSKLIPIILLIWFLAAVGIFVYALKLNHWVIGKESLISVLPPPLKLVAYGAGIVPVLTLIALVLGKDTMGPYNDDVDNVIDDGLFYN